MPAPIIFIHKGDSDYLQHTMKCAKLFNPEKEVVLLGDKENEHLKSLGIKHELIEDYNKSSELEVFNKVYQFVAGPEHGKSEWTKFVFERWYIMYNFITKNDIHQFWTFDSDNLIIGKLSTKEAAYSKYDCTAQCLGICMNGWVSNQKVVHGYLLKMNELFEREEYLNRQRQDFELNPHYAFTEMRAFEAYRAEENITVFRINEILHQEAFDECIACTHHNMKMSPFKINDVAIKELYTDNNGFIYSFYTSTKQYIRLNNLNISWLPLYVYDRLLSAALPSIGKEFDHLKFDYNTIKQIDLAPSRDFVKKNLKAKRKQKLYKIYSSIFRKN